jgi:hypothetical protein
MPVIDGEASYEMLNDSLPTEWTRRMFWLCLMNGAAGHTYGANGIWQCNRPGQPHGASPHGGSYGQISWNEAMNLPGSRQVGLAKAFLERFPWHRFEPHPEWAISKREPSLNLDGCHWIWFPEGDPAKDAPAAKRLFRHTFVLPDGKPIERACLRVSADDGFAAKLNGQSLGIGDDWRYGRQFDGLGRLLKGGTNLLAIIAENKPTALPANPAGLIGCLEVQFSDGKLRRFESDDTWRCATKAVTNWDSTGFDDRTWAKALVVGHYGDGPWGRIGRLNDNDSSDPQSAGVVGLVRIIYVPEHELIEVRNLGSRAKYVAAYFDPVSGEKAALGIVQADNSGLWKCLPPLEEDHDWVLVLENSSRKPNP